MEHTMELHRKIAALETELRIEKEQHAAARQCVNYIALQLSQQHFTTTHPADAHTRSQGLEKSPNRRNTEPEDLLSWDNNTPCSWIQSPALSPSLTPDRAYNKHNLNHSHKDARHVSFDKNQDTANNTTTNATDQPILISLDPNEVIQDDPPAPKISALAQCRRDLKKQREERFPPQLTVQTLSDRYKDTKPPLSGLESSKWADKGKTQLDESQDLMQFPDSNNDTEEEERVGTPDDDDDKSSEDAMRTVLATNIPLHYSVADVASLVYGGIIVAIRPLHTTRTTGSESIMITFLQAADARFFAHAMRKHVTPKFKLLESAVYPVSGHLENDMLYKGMTRCLVIYKMHPDVTMGELCKILEPGTRHHGILNVGRDEYGVCHVEFASVVAAQVAIGCICSNPFFRHAEVQYEDDPCDYIPTDNSDMDEEEMTEEEIIEEGVAEEVADKEGSDKEGSDKEGSDKEGSDKEGSDKEGSDKEGSDKEGSDKAEVDKDGIDKDGVEEEQVKMEVGEKGVEKEVANGKEDYAKEAEHSQQLDSDFEDDAETQRDVAGEKDADGWPVGGLDYD
jgi:hypothetical protein